MTLAGCASSEADNAVDAGGWPSATVINQNADSVRSEVEIIADKSNSINDYSKQMKENADEMESNAKANMQETSIKVQEILEVLNQAIEDSKSVEQVNG